MQDDDRTGTENTPSATAIACHVDLLDAVQCMLGEIHQFMQSFWERMHAALARQNEDLIGLDGEANDWECKRVKAEEHINEQVHLLAEAWLRLEAEQRELLQRQSGLYKTNRSQGTQPPPRDGLPAIGLPGTQPDLLSSPRMQQSAAREFERLRREIFSTRPHTEVQRD